MITKVQKEDIAVQTLYLLYKNGDKKDPKNYRPISCTNVIYKIYTSIIQNKIKKELSDN